MFRSIRLIIFVALCALTHSLQAQNRVDRITISGRVVTGANNEPVSYAAVLLEPRKLSTVTNDRGEFRISLTAGGVSKIVVSCLGYLPYEEEISADRSMNISIRLTAQGFSIEEVTVMAKKTEGSEALQIDQTAIEYVQPTSLHDIFLLLPGSVYTEGAISNFKPIAMRQAGSESNSSLGVGVMTDGVPLSSDGMRTQMVGITSGASSYGDTQISKRSSINKGADLRYISTDHIESVEVGKGIASAKYGNMTSGLITVNSKKGESPLRIRLKADLKNKLAYVGKGIKLKDDKGTLNLGIDYLDAIDDVREATDKFSRMTAQAYYSRLWSSEKRQFEWDVRASQTFSLNQMKYDELIYEYKEEFRANYLKGEVMTKGVLTQSDSFIDKLDFTLSTRVVDDRIDRLRFVLSTSGALSQPTAWEEGEHEGIYLPAAYYSEYYVENIPINLFFKLNALSNFNFTKNFFVNAEYGADFSMTKNIGDGAVMADPTRPPYPYDNAYMRPRSNRDIPALINAAAYLQSDWIYSQDANMVKLSAGARLTQMLNLPTEYYLNGKSILDPRASLSYSHKGGIGSHRVTNSVRAGYGIENKLPTMDYLYPEKIYKDFAMMNYFSNDAEYRRLITHTEIYETYNPNITTNANHKMEIGYDLTVDDFELSLTLFNEFTNSGFAYQNFYTPVSYNQYINFIDGVDLTGRQPEKSDYVEQLYNTFTTYNQVTNTQTVQKRGLEYRIVFPRIDALNTQLEINGAYYDSQYGTTLPEVSYSGIVIANASYPYVATYENYARWDYKQLNTNFWFNTHIPRFGLMFTNFFQVVWIDSNQYYDERNIYPSHLMGFDGVQRPILDSEIESIRNYEEVYRYLEKSITPLNYALNPNPISMVWNIKATKELMGFARLSFFVNNIIDVNPKYTSGSLTTGRNWVNPYFGMELFINL